MQRILIGCLAILSLLLLAAGCSDNHASLPQKSNTVTLRIANEDAAHTPPWVAFQDGDGPWQVCQRTDSGAYAASITNPEGRYSFAVGTEGMVEMREMPPLLLVVALYHGTVAEMPKLTVVLPHYGGANTATATVAGTISGLTDPAHGIIATNSSSMYAVSTSPVYSLPVPPGQRDILAALWPSSSAERPERIAMLRDRTVNGTRTENIDFATLPAVTSATINLANGTANRAFVRLLADDGVDLEVASLGVSLPCTSFRYACPSPDQQAASDRYFAEARADISDMSIVGVEQFFTGGDQTMAFPNPLSGVTIALNTTGATPVPTLTWASYPADFFTLTLTQRMPNSDVEPYYMAVITKGWLRGATSYTVPAGLSALAGWDPRLTMSATAPVDASIYACTTNLSIGQALAMGQRAYPAAGGTVTYAAMQTSTLAGPEPTALHGPFPWLPCLPRPAAE